MTVLGWVFMISSLVFVCALTGWCFYRVFTAKPDVDEPPQSLGP